MPAKSAIAKKILTGIAQYVEKKSELDSVINLNTTTSKSKEHYSAKKVENPEGYMTLLSEGSVLYSDDTIRLYITKGTLKQWYDNLSDDFEGYVTTGHVSLDAFPVRDGYFRKEDLKVVVDEQGRHDILVKPHVNMELSNIKDLLLQDEPFSISSEFMWTEKQYTDDDIEEYAKLVVYNVEHGGDIDIPVTDKVDIMGFSFVGNPGNAKSGGYEPSLYLRNEEMNLNKKDILEKVLARFAQDEAETVVEETPVVEETVEEVKEETVEVATEEVVEGIEPVELSTEKPAEKSELFDKIEKEVEALRAEVADLRAEKEQLEKENQELKANESEVNEQFSKLEALLTKASAKVEKAPVKEELSATTNRFGRVRFGGQ